jgi:uncharacterized protein YyaL (SSP411 family)
MRRMILNSLAVALCSSASGFAADQSVIVWKPWSDSVFAEAKSEQRFVLLDLGTVWCHWCHVMDEVTYRDPGVIDLVRKRYIAVRVDADSRPDLSNRYEDYGWPATIVFNADGEEIVKRRGYLPPRSMASMLQAIIDDPTPGPSVGKEVPLTPGTESALANDTRNELRQILVGRYDSSNRGWGTMQKFLDADIIECSMNEAQRGDERFEHMARETLSAELQLMDPVWGGVYQYSTDGDWRHPHFEKIMQRQADDLRIYAIAYGLWHDKIFVSAAQRIRGFLREFLVSPEGAFYTSQDADLIPGRHGGDYFQLSDAERRKKGIPRVDVHIYSRENGWAIRALAMLGAVSDERQALAEAIRAANWICANRELPRGGFRHDEMDVAGPYLGDTLSMGRAFLTLYACTADRAWLKRAEDAADFVDANFKDDLGYVSTAVKGALKSKPQFDENVGLARFANLLFHCSGKTGYRELAEHAMRFLAAPHAADHRGFLIAGLLLADRELGSPPQHLTVVGGKDDPAAQALFEAAIKLPGTYRRIEWWDKREGPLPNADVEYPTLGRAAAFRCTDNSCSPPIYLPERLMTQK